MDSSPRLPLKHWQRALLDALQHSTWIRRLSARFLSAAGGFASSSQTRLALLTRAYARAEDEHLETRLAARIAREEVRSSSLGELWAGLSATNTRYSAAMAKSSLVNRGVLLKVPGASGEKGVMLVTFEYNWLRMLRGIQDWTALEASYDIIFSNSWSPSDYALVLEVLARLKGDMFVQTNNRDDIARLSRLNRRIHGVPTMPSDWVHPDYFHTKPHAERAFDIVMVANWAPFKRHWEFFAVLRHLPAEWRILLIGQPEARHVMADVQALARAYGVQQEITWKESIPIHEVSALQAEGRISVVLSRREGACVAAAEALLADSPVALRADAHLGSLVYVNEQTGILLRSRCIARDIATLWERAPGLKTREHAKAIHSAEASTRVLNDFMRASAQRRGLPWTRDIAAHCWRPYPSLMRQSDQESMKAACAALQSEYTGVFDSSLISITPLPAAA